MEAFEELYCRFSALEILVFAMAQQIDKERFAKDLILQKKKLLATATFASLSEEVAQRMTLNIDRYARVILGDTSGDG
jgi:hypothetical protein